MVVLPVLASALHLDPVLNQVQGADEALGDLIHFGDPVFLFPTLTLDQDRFLARHPERSGDETQGAVCKSLSVDESVKCTDKIII